MNYVTTAWFSGAIAPAHIGPYEIQRDINGVGRKALSTFGHIPNQPMFAYWKNGWWALGADSPDETISLMKWERKMGHGPRPAMESMNNWRGIAKEQ